MITSLYCERWPPKWREPAKVCKPVKVEGRLESLSRSFTNSRSFTKCEKCGGRRVLSYHSEVPWESTPR